MPALHFAEAVALHLSIGQAPPLFVRHIHSRAEACYYHTSGNVCENVEL